MLFLGKVEMYLLLGGFGICVDLVVYLGYLILFFYDLMVVKLIVYGKICEEVIVKMKCVFSEFVIEGVYIIILFYL